MEKQSFVFLKIKRSLSLTVLILIELNWETQRMHWTIFFYFIKNIYLLSKANILQLYRKLLSNSQRKNMKVKMIKAQKKKRKCLSIDQAFTQQHVIIIYSNHNNKKKKKTKQNSMSKNTNTVE